MTDPLTPRFPGTATALVVDDVGVARRVAFRLLSETGYRVFEAADAVEALEVLEQAGGRVDLVLVDVVLGGVSGVDLIKLIRARWLLPAVVYMSAHPAEILVREGLNDPRVVFLAKPFTRDELLAAITRALASRPRRDAEGHGAPRREEDGGL
jgi:two-component system cell cycle sensor histidine kinase/response regulator CckA